MRIAVVFIILLALVVSPSLAQTDSIGTILDTSQAEQQGERALFTTTADDLDSDILSQDVSGLLQASRDVFTSTAGFNLGAARYRMRGYGFENTTVMINGVPVNNMERGAAYWSNWGGLNDVTRYPTQSTGLAASPYGFSGIGGYSNVSTRASDLRPGKTISYALANRTYNHRLMLTANSGMKENGWAYSLSGSRRWAEEGYVEGTFFDAWSYYASVEKRINSRHSVSVTGFGTPIVQGRNGITVKEAYDLAGNNFYNPNWGYQEGKKRNARVSNTHQPILVASHYFKIDDKSNLNTSMLYMFGRSGFSRLNWFDARDPRPDYYRYLPSNYDDNPIIANQLTNLWQTDENVRQIDWDRLYFANRKNLYTVEDVNGVVGNNFTGNRSKYIVEESRTDVVQKSLSSVYDRSITDKLRIHTGLQATLHKSKNFKVLEDLLGGEFWLDVDQFAERDFADPEVAKNDLDNPNQLIGEGDIFGWNYDINVNKFELYGQAEYKLPKIETYLSAAVSNTTFWRTGHVRNGKFPNNSAGESAKQNFLNYGVKAGVVYKVTGRHFITTNGAYLTRAPFTYNAYLSPRTRDNIVQNLQSEEILSWDINYIVRYPKLRTRLTYYYSEENNVTWSRSFFMETFNNLGNYILTGLDYQYYGGEFGLSTDIAKVLELTTAIGHGRFLINSRPSTSFVLDNSNETLVEDRTSYMQNYRMGTMPQSAGSVGLRYNSPKYWSVGVNFNYFTDIYLDANPDRRTEAALEKYMTSDPQWSKIIDQTKLDDGYTFNLFAMKSWKIKDYYIRANFSVNNILNNTEFITGGFEQLRYDSNDIDRFPPRFSYMFGRNYFVGVSFQF